MAKTPQEQTDELMLAVGRALQAWASVEEAVVLLFSEAIQAEPKRLGLLVMSGIVSFEAKVKVTSGVVRFRLDGDADQPVWDKLTARILKFYKRRHELAHFNLITDLDEAVPRVRFCPYGFFASVAAGDRKYLSLEQIQERTSKFEEIRDAVHFFMWQKMLAHNWPQEEPRWPVPDLVRQLRTLVDQSHEAPPQPPRSSEVK